MTHRCNAKGCAARVPQNIFMCGRHWRMVPKPLREAISTGWSMGAGSPYHENCDEAIRVVADAEAGRAMPGVEPGMKALTVWQPWASLIMIGAKPWEFRSWNFSDQPGLRRLVGQRIVIHAGAHKPKLDKVNEIIDRIQEGESALDRDLGLHLVNDVRAAVLAKRPLPIPLSAALGTVTLGQPRRAYDLFVDKVADPDRLDPDMYAWPVSDPQPFPEPIPAAGAQGFWNYS